ncbi:MAG TPA: DUF222 domain-containing protein, partial [Actinomycetes bacterium]|nr:DUF222 domain-containing protein [Actinomycetes bacterium]
MSNSFIECAAAAQRSLLSHEWVTTGFGTMDDDALREAVAVLEALSHSAQAIQADVIAEIAGRARRHDDAEAARIGYYGPHCTEEFVVDELALLLSSTRHAASHRYDRAVRTARSASVMAAWRSGQIDGDKAESIAHSYAVCGETLTDEQMDRLIDASLQYATGHTAPQLREWLRRRQIAADPAAAERRRRIAQGERRVVIRHLDDGVSELWALLPTVAARRIQQILDQVARESRGGDPEDLMDNRRADALVELLTGEIDPPPVSVQVVVPVDVLTGTSDEPAWIPGVGPITAPEARTLAGPTADDAHRTVFRRLVTDPATGALTDLAEEQYRPSARLERAVRARDLTC